MGAKDSTGAGDGAPVGTVRLVLRALRGSDAADLTRLMTPAVSARLSNWPVPFTLERAAKRIADGAALAASGDGALHAIVRRADGALMGCVWVRRRPATPRTGGMGYWLGEKFHGQGYMREAALAARDDAFRRFGFEAIEAGSQPDNAASLAVMRALGMSRCREETHFAPARGRDEPVVYFAVRRGEIAPILGAMDDSAPTACILVIGNEILSGRTKDTNSGWLAERLTAMGIRLREIRVIPDIEDVIVAVVNETRAKYTYVFTSGGIGPTHDDITAEAIAKAFGVPWEINPEARAILRSNYKSDDELTPARLRMATLPRGAEMIANPISKAPGFRTGNVYTMAGVPRILQAMFEGIAGRLKGGPVLLSHTVVGNVAEGRMGDALAEIQKRHPDLEIGSYPGQRPDGTFRNAVVVRGLDRARLAAAAAEAVALIRSLGGEASDEPPPP